MTTPHLPNNLYPTIDWDVEDPYAAARESFVLTGKFSSPHGHLFERILWASAHLKPVQPDYCVVYEDPDEPDAPVKIMVAAPEWLAMALHGNLLPPIEAYLADAQEPDDAPKRHPYAEPIGPMTEEEAMEYLIMKDVPRRVWDRPGANRPTFAIVPRNSIPADQTHRDAWRLNDFIKV